MCTSILKHVLFRKLIHENLSWTIWVGHKNPIVVCGEKETGIKARFFPKGNTTAASPVAQPPCTKSPGPMSPMLKATETKQKPFLQ